MMPHVLPTTFDEDMAKLIHDELIKNGVELHLNEKVVGFRGGVNGHVNKVITEKGEYNVDKVVMGVGVKPDVDLAVKAGAKLGETGGLSGLMSTWRPQYQMSMPRVTWPRPGA